MLCWAVSPILIRYVREWFSVSFQNFYRFGISIAILWIFTLLNSPKGGIKAALKQVRYPLPKLLCIAVCNFAHQFFLIKGVYTLLPGLVTIVEESTIIFTVALAFAFLPEERSFIKSPRFIAGIVLAVAGVIVTAVPDLSGTQSASYSGAAFGIVFILVSSFAWAVFSLLIRLWLPEMPSSITSSLVFTLVVPFFLISMLAGGSDILPASVPAAGWFILSVSGVLGIGIAYPCYYTALKGLGVTLTSSLGLLIPIMTAAISFFVFDEVLGPVQTAGAAMLLGGCFIVVRTKFSL